MRWAVFINKAEGFVETGLNQNLGCGEDIQFMRSFENESPSFYSQGTNDGITQTAANYHKGTQS